MIVKVEKARAGPGGAGPEKTGMRAGSAGGGKVGFSRRGILWVLQPHEGTQCWVLVVLFKSRPEFFTLC